MRALDLELKILGKHFRSGAMMGFGKKLVLAVFIAMGLAACNMGSKSSPPPPTPATDTKPDKAKEEDKSKNSGEDANSGQTSGGGNSSPTSSTPNSGDAAASSGKVDGAAQAAGDESRCDKTTQSCDKTGRTASDPAATQMALAAFLPPSKKGKSSSAVGTRPSGSQTVGEAVVPTGPPNSPASGLNTANSKAAAVNSVSSVDQLNSGTQRQQILVPSVSGGESTAGRSSAQRTGKDDSRKEVDSLGSSSPKALKGAGAEALEAQRTPEQILEVYSRRYESVPLKGLYGYYTVSWSALKLFPQVEGRLQIKFYKGVSFNSKVTPTVVLDIPAFQTPYVNKVAVGAESLELNVKVVSQIEEVPKSDFPEAKFYITLEETSLPTQCSPMLFAIWLKPGQKRMIEIIHRDFCSREKNSQDLFEF